MFRTYIGSTEGVHRLEDGELTSLGLDGKTIWAIHAFNRTGGDSAETDIILAGSDGGAT